MQVRGLLRAILTGQRPCTSPLALEARNAVVCCSPPVPPMSRVRISSSPRISTSMPWASSSLMRLSSLSGNCAACKRRGRSETRDVQRGNRRWCASHRTAGPPRRSASRHSLLGASLRVLKRVLARFEYRIVSLRCKEMRKEAHPFSLFERRTRRRKSCWSTIVDGVVQSHLSTTASYLFCRHQSSMKHDTKCSMMCCSAPESSKRPKRREL